MSQVTMHTLSTVKRLKVRPLSVTVQVTTYNSLQSVADKYFAGVLNVYINIYLPCYILVWLIMRKLL